MRVGLCRSSNSEISENGLKICPIGYKPSFKPIPRQNLGTDAYDNIFVSAVLRIMQPLKHRSDVEVSKVIPVREDNSLVSAALAAAPLPLKFLKTVQTDRVRNFADKIKRPAKRVTGVSE